MSAFISYPKDAKPHINWNHVDGPLLHCRNGHMHWLTLWERIKFKFGYETIESLEIKYWNWTGL